MINFTHIKEIIRHLFPDGHQSTSEGIVILHIRLSTFTSCKFTDKVGNIMGIGQLHEEAVHLRSKFHNRPVRPIAHGKVHFEIPRAVMNCFSVRHMDQVLHLCISHIAPQVLSHSGPSFAILSKSLMHLDMMTTHAPKYWISCSDR